MAQKYNPHAIESKWRERWPKERRSFDIQPGDEPYYCLDMFPYPSSEGLHMGHWRPYTIADVWARYQTMLGKKVMHPVGFDAFGLPAENAAIKTKVHPAAYTKKSITNFSRQLDEIGAMYDWSTCTVTSDPEYYKWTQWLFLQLYKKGLAYRKSAPVWWCPSCQTVLANEQVEDGKCERCKTEVLRKELKQWFFKITAFAEDLIKFDDATYPDRVKTLQTNWIGKSEGAEIDFVAESTGDTIRVFTTRPDTLMGVTYVVVAPEYPLLEQLTTHERAVAVHEYVTVAGKKSEIDRLAEDRPKTGVFTGSYVLHPISGERVPVWVADYVVGSYGTGAVMGVPAHDTRDFAFAKDYDLPITFVIAPDDRELDVSQPHIAAGTMINSELFNGLRNNEASKAIVTWLNEHNKGRNTVQYRLRDWLISRQRYWGAPIPIVYCDTCGEQPVADIDLPVLLPDDAEFIPTGGSPLERHPSFTHAICPKCGGSAMRETDTLDTFVDSSWYYLRYTSPDRTDVAWDNEQVKAWLPVDFYIGGIEHAILHLLYSRFITKALHSLDLVPYAEPFGFFYGVGLVFLHGSKMSKSKGNVVNPDEMVKKYGTDALRGYILFMGPADQDVEWQTSGISGVSRFLYRAWDVFHRVDTQSSSPSISPAIQQAYAKVSELLPQFQFNRCISALMIALNDLAGVRLSKREAEVLIQLFAPFFPHFAEEIWTTVLGHDTSIFAERWPQVTVEAAATLTYAVQVNGKVRGTLNIARDADEPTVIAAAKKLPAVSEFLDGHEVVRTIFVAGRIVNFVIK